MILCLVDEQALSLTKIKYMTQCCLHVDSPEEAGRYLETYKSYEKKPADLLKEQVEKDYLSKVVIAKNRFF